MIFRPCVPGPFCALTVAKAASYDAEENRVGAISVKDYIPQPLMAKEPREASFPDALYMRANAPGCADAAFFESEARPMM
jgi:hypothetical protein